MSVEYYRKKLIDLRAEVKKEQEAKKRIMPTMPIELRLRPRRQARLLTVSPK